MDELNNQYNFLLYQGKDGNKRIQVFLDRETETIWTTQKGMGEIFGTTPQNITIHLKNIFESDELKEISVCKEILHTASDGKKYKTKFYNLDVIISIGYRVNSQKATDFRIWATRVLREYIIKGFVLDDERLKQGKEAFGRDYFDELLERIREIRASERRFYQKITDIYSQCSIDYDRHSPITQKFYATVQNKLHYAINNCTAAELLKMRADSTKPNMGLTSWKNEKNGGKILKSDVSIAKNYLSEEELGNLNRIVSMYLDFAENLAKRNKIMTMSDWAKKLDSFLEFNEYHLLNNAGNISAKVAKQIAESEYKKFRIIQDQEYKSDFDNVVNEIKTSGKLSPRQMTLDECIDNIPKENLSSFNNNMKQALNYNLNKENKKKKRD